MVGSTKHQFCFCSNIVFSPQSHRVWWVAKDFHVIMKGRQSPIKPIANHSFSSFQLSPYLLISSVGSVGSSLFHPFSTDCGSSSVALSKSTYVSGFKSSCINMVESDGWCPYFHEVNIYNTRWYPVDVISNLRKSPVYPSFLVCFHPPCPSTKPLLLAARMHQELPSAFLRQTNSNKLGPCMKYGGVTNKKRNHCLCYVYIYI